MFLGKSKSQSMWLACLRAGRNRAMPPRTRTDGLFLVERALRHCAKRIQTYRLTYDRESEVLDRLFEDLLAQADQVRMIAQPIVVTYRK